MDNQPVYKPDIKKIKGILNHPRIYTILPERNLELVKKTVGLMVSHLKKKSKDIKEDEANQIKMILNLLLVTVIEKPITPILKDLVNELIVLSASWNETVAKRLEIREMIYSLRRLIDSHLSFSDLIMATKILVKKTEEIQRFSPPAFEISAHYLKSIQELESKDTKKNKAKLPREELKKILNEGPPQC